jgi:hypothetical protein
LGFGQIQALQALDPFARQQARVQIKTHPEALIKELMLRQISMTPDSVGLPIAVAYLDRGGLHFIEKGACP